MILARAASTAPTGLTSPGDQIVKRLDEVPDHRAGTPPSAAPPSCRGDQPGPEQLLARPPRYPRSAGMRSSDRRASGWFLSFVASTGLVERGSLQFLLQLTVNTSGAGSGSSSMI